MSAAALGFRAHSGWAVVVALEGIVEAPRVILRRRLEMLDRSITGAKQPYHTAAGMPLADAAAFLDRCREATHAVSTQALQCVLDEITRKGFQTSSAYVLLGSGRHVPDLKTILRSHPLLHTAEGEFYREALITACTNCGLPVRGVKEKEAAQQLPLDHLDTRIADLGKLIGPPWGQDEKLSAIAAWISLFSSSQSSCRS